VNPPRHIEVLAAMRLTISLLVFVFGCQTLPYQYRPKQSLPAEIERVAVVGFYGALSAEESPGLFHCPLCGAVFMAEPVPDNVARDLSFDLYTCLQASHRYALVSPSQAREVFSWGPSQSVTSALQATAKALSADAVLFGYVYRWRERAGTAYAVSSAASIGFDLHLVSSEDGAILWKDSFTKTQLSLSENVLDISTFIKSGSKWLTARELARIGIEDMIKEVCQPF
jgi:hypothetical protein